MSKLLNRNKIPRGSTGTFEITSLNLAELPETSPIKEEGFLTPGFILSFYCKRDKNDSDEEAVFVKSSENVGDISPITSTTAFVNLNPDDTKDEKIPKDKNEITLYYTVELRNASGTIRYKSEEDGYFFLVKTSAGE